MPPITAIGARRNSNTKRRFPLMFASVSPEPKPGVVYRREAAVALAVGRCGRFGL